MIDSDVAALSEKVDRRAIVLDRLEIAEARYIRHRDQPEEHLKAGRLNPDSKSSRATGAEVPSLGKNLFSRSREASILILGFASDPSGQVGPIEEKPGTVDPAFQTPVAQQPNTGETGTRFQEINRDSAQFGRDFKIGQRIRVDEQGMYVPDYSPNSSSEDGRLSGEGLLSATTISSTGSADSFHTPPQSAIPRSSLATVPPPSAGLQAERNRHEEYDVEIAARRIEFIALNNEIEVLQQDTFSGISAGQAGMGWIIVGRGVEWMTHAEIIEGYTKEDILWKNVDRSSGEKRYFVKVAIVGFALFLLGESVNGWVSDRTDA